MPKGIVKWFNNAKGYGFIVPESGGDDLFAHYSAVTMDGYKSLNAGDEVEFEVTVGDKGPQATNIVTVARAAASQAGQDTDSQDATEEADQSSNEAT